MKLLDKIKFALAKPLLKSVSIGLSSASDVKAHLSQFLTTQNTSKNSGYVSSCANVWGLSFAQAIPRVYNSDNNNEEWENHPAVEVLKNPFPYFTGWELMYRIASDLIFEGNCYILKLRPQVGRGLTPVTGLFPLQADRMDTFPHGVERIDHYEYNTGTGITKFPLEDIIHLKSPDRKSTIKGSPVISRISDVVDVEKMQIEYRKLFYKKGGFLGATFTTSKDMGKESFNRMLEVLREKYGGSENAFKIALFDNDIKPVPTAYSLKDMQITEDRKLNMEEICAAFNVNKLFFGQSENIQRGNAETVFYVFYAATMDPLLIYVAQAFTNQFLSVDFRASDNSAPLYFAFDPLAQRDKTTDYANYKAALDAGWIWPSEIRESEGYGPDETLDNRFLQSKSQAQPATI